MRTLLAIPVKPIDAAKSRLAAVLDGEERGNLALQWLDRLLDAATGAAVDAVAVVSADPDALALAAARGAYPVPEAAAGGLNAAIAQLAPFVAAIGAQRMVVLAGDLPGLTAADIGLLLAAAPVRGVLVASDQHERGTSALVLTPPNVVAPGFEGDSLARHRAAALAAGVDFVELRNAAFDDVDTPEDFSAWRRRSTG
jgi:2-phospho-L-lactate guanylyltransferase